MPRSLLLSMRVAAVLLLGTVAARLPAAEPAPPAPGIAIAVVFDTSGSMNQPVATKKGAPADAKYRVAQRAFGTVLDRLERFTKGPAVQPLHVGVYVFHGNDAVVAEPIAPFHPARLRRWLAGMRPTGSTPLGNAIFLAGRDLLATPVTSRHLLVLTDGANTAGRTPESALAQVNAAAARKQIAVFTHIIALDIAPATFKALAQQGATLIGAADEAQLTDRFDFILEEKILVEKPR